MILTHLSKPFLTTLIEFSTSMLHQKGLANINLNLKQNPGSNCKNLCQSRTNYLVITLIEKTFLRKLNFTLNISYRNMLYALMKKSKRNYFTNFLKKTNTWKGIKSIISVKSSSSNSPTLLTF